eukprot:m51a1_g13645 hypothetical protein (109) ;mRNA; f:1448-1774
MVSHGEIRHAFTLLRGIRLEAWLIDQAYVRRASAAAGVRYTFDVDLVLATERTKRVAQWDADAAADSAMGTVWYCLEGAPRVVHTCFGTPYQVRTPAAPLPASPQSDF